MRRPRTALILLPALRLMLPLTLLLTLLLAGCGTDDQGPALPSDLPLALPVVGTVGAPPPATERIPIALTRDGYLHVPGRDEPLSLVALRAWLREQTSRLEARAPDGSSLRTAYLHIDKDTPWRAVQWLLMTCAHPEVRMWNIAFAARTPDGSHGAIGITLPMDRGPTPTPLAFPPYHRIKLFQRDVGHTKQPVRDLDELAAALDALPKDTTGVGAVFDVITPPPSGGRVPYATVLRIVDASLAAGARFVSLEGAAMPRAEEGGRDTLADPQALAALFTELKARGGTTHVRLGDSLETIPYAASAAPRGRGRIAGRWGTSLDDWPLLDELEEEVEVLEEVDEAADDAGDDAGDDGK